MDDADLLGLLPEVQDALASNFEGIECTVGPGPDLGSKPFYLPFGHIGKQITFLPDVTHTENAGFDATGLQRLSLNKTSAVFTDGQSGACLELVLGTGSDWKTPLTNLFTRLYPTKWAFLILELVQGRALFHLLSSSHPAVSGTGKKEGTPDAIVEAGKAANFTLWIVPVTRIFAVPPVKKKIVRRIVKKKSPPKDGTEGSPEAEGEIGEKKRIIKRIVKKVDGSEVASTESRSEKPRLTNGHEASVSPESAKMTRQKSPETSATVTEPSAPTPLTFGYGEIGSKREDSNENEISVSKERREELLAKYLNGNRSSNDESKSSTLTNGTTSSSDEASDPSRSTAVGSSGYGSASEFTGLEAGASSSSLLTPSWSSTITSSSGLSRSPSTSSTIRPEDFDHAASRTRSERLRQRLASLDRASAQNSSTSSIPTTAPRLSTPNLDESDSLSDLRKRLIGLSRDTPFAHSSSSINEKFQSALLASRRVDLQTSSSRSRLQELSRKSRSPPLGPIVEVVSADGQKSPKCDICTDPIVNCGCGGSPVPGLARSTSQLASGPNGMNNNSTGNMPFLVLREVLRRLSYAELGRLRQVHPHWDEICGQMLNAGYYRLIERSDKLLMRLQRLVQKDPGMYYPTSVLTNIQVHILNQVDVMRAALDEGVGCFPYGVLLDKTIYLVSQIEKIVNEGRQIDVAWEPVAVLAKRASMHYKENLESVMEERLGESARLKAAQKLIRLDSFLVESSVQKMEKENAKNRDDIMWELEQMQQTNEKLRKDNRELKQNQMKLEARIEILEQKFKTMARLFS